MYRFIESVCVRNGRVERAEYHLRRIERSLRDHCGKGGVDLFWPWFEGVKFPQKGVFKWRFEYGVKGIIRSELIPYERVPITTLRMVAGDHLSYDYKYADRSGIEALFAQRSGADDILIVKNGYLSDTSYANVVLWNGRDWHTPLQPLLKGTRRASLLDSGAITESNIAADRVWEYKRLRLINAMLPFSELAEITITKDTVL
jgi:4-amino-4-deoxychorismate lyase